MQKSLTIHLSITLAGILLLSQAGPATAAAPPAADCLFCGGKRRQARPCEGAPSENGVEVPGD
jgi:hypothetical protein